MSRCSGGGDIELPSFVKTSGSTDLLLRLAEHDVFRPLWSAKILAETVESIVRRRPDLDPHLLRKRMDAMNEAFPDACVSGFEHLIPTMPEMGADAHVLAAALFAGADLIVTDNVKDFPPNVAPRFEIAVKTANAFLVQQPDQDMGSAGCGGECRRSQSRMT